VAKYELCSRAVSGRRWLTCAGTGGEYWPEVPTRRPAVARVRESGIRQNVLEGVARRLPDALRRREWQDVLSFEATREAA